MRDEEEKQRAREAAMHEMNEFVERKRLELDEARSFFLLNYEISWRFITSRTFSLQSKHGSSVESPQTNCFVRLRCNPRRHP